MDLTLYNLLTQQLPDKPNVAIVQDRQPLPEAWPLVLKTIDTFRKQVLGFVVTDGQTQLYCTSSLPEVYDRVNAIELGTIIHLIGSETYFSDQQKGYCVDVQTVYTLKEYDSYMKEHQLLEQERLAKLREQDYLDQFVHEVQE